MGGTGAARGPALRPAGSEREVSGKSREDYFCFSRPRFHLRRFWFPPCGFGSKAKMYFFDHGSSVPLLTEATPDGSFDAGQVEERTLRDRDREGERVPVSELPG